ncbi:phosphotransferase enzyme family protein [Mesorhizobium sp. L-2-11]|uniref:phosphotransferase enzyme family protein n=1 Tax=Mesorhizobium sp. L-2-11 TaxID=2744521 RepID=UPI0018ECAF95|nr:phosphotransferase [Mesorhizobium sp. L-2-11]
MMVATNDTAAVERVVAAALEAEYRLSAEVRTVVRGVNWTLAAGPDRAPVAYVRLYRPEGRPKAEIAAELAVLDAVVATDRLDVARAVASQKGQLLTQLEVPGSGTRPMAVFQVAAGEPVRARPDDLRAAGAALADLHGQTQLAALAPQRELAAEGEIDRTIARIEDGFATERARLVAAVADLRGQGMNRAAGPAGFCHSDFRMANLHRAIDRIVMFDFDDCGLGPQWLDLATVGWWLELATGDGAAELWRAFLTGYDRAKDDAELSNSLRWLVAVQHLRSLRFLQDYCQLDTETWVDALGSAAGMVERAASGSLRFLRGS